MPIATIEVERFSLISSKPFDDVVEVLKAAVGRPDMAQFAKATKGARTFTELQSEIQKGLGRTGLMTLHLSYDRMASFLAPYGNDEA